MRERTPTPEVEALYAKVKALTEQIAASEEQTEALRTERNRVFVELRAAGENQAVIARRVGLTPQAISFAVRRVNDRSASDEAQAQ